MMGGTASRVMNFTILVPGMVWGEAWLCSVFILVWGLSFGLRVCGGFILALKDSPEGSITLGIQVLRYKLRLLGPKTKLYKAFGLF